VQVLADVAGIQVQVAVAALGIAPNGAVGHRCPDEGHRARQHLPLVHAGFRQAVVEGWVHIQGDQLVLAGSKAVQPGCQSVHTVDRKIGLKGVPAARRGHRAPDHIALLIEFFHALGQPQQVGEFLQ